MFSVHTGSGQVSIEFNLASLEGELSRVCGVGCGHALHLVVVVHHVLLERSSLAVFFDMCEKMETKQ